MGRAHLARSRIDSYKKRIQTCENYKKHFVDHLQNLKNKCLNREISYEEYQNLTQKKQEDKTCEEWISYYDSYIKESKEIIETERKIITRNNVISSVTTFFFIALLIFALGTQGSKIIVFTIQDSSQEYSEELNLHFENSTSYKWHPNNKGQLTSLQISGKILGKGSAKIYLDNILILDSNSIERENAKSLLTGFSIQTGYNPEEIPESTEIKENITTPNTQTKEKEAESSEEEVSPSPSKPASAPNEIIFKKHCEDSCSLEQLILDYNSYPIKIELNKAKIEISSITYKVIPLENESIINEPIQQNETLEKNKTEEINQTENNLTLILNETQIINISKLKILKSIPEFKVSKSSSLEINLKEYFENAENYSIENNNLIFTLEKHNLKINIPSNFTEEKIKIIAYAENEFLESNEFTISSFNNSISLIQTRGKIRVGQPVKWTSNISLNSVENLTITLPEEAQNIEIKEFNPEKETLSLSPITGNIIKDSNSKNNFIKRFLEKLRSSFTGYAISEENNEESPETNIILEDNSKEYIIEYETEAPKSYEKDNNNGKEITISGPDELHYTDIIASTNIPDYQKITSESQIKILWHDYDKETNTSIKKVKNILQDTVLKKSEIEVGDIPYISLNDENNGSLNKINQENNYILKEVPFDSYDLNGDGNLDYLEWVVPHLSNQTFTIYFTSANSSTPSNNITFEGHGNNQFSHLSIDTKAGANFIYDDLVAYWNFDKDNASTTFDLKGGYEATLSGGVVSNETNCVYDECLQLDGTDDYASGSDAGFPTGNRTLSLWFRTNFEGNRFFFGYAGADWYTNFYAGVYDDGAAECPDPLTRYVVVVGTGGTGTNTCGRTAVNDSKWHHTAIVYNQVNWTIFLDGVHDGSRVTQTTTALGGLYTIGAEKTPSGYFNGLVDEVMFFNISLNASDILQIYRNQSARFVNPGIQEVKQFNISSNAEKFNLSVQNYERKFNTNISLSIGGWDITKDYNTSDINSTANGLVIYYNFDNRSSLGETETLVADRRGNNNGTVNGGNGTTSIGVYEKSMRFDGVNDDINTTTNLGVISTALWYKNLTQTEWIFVANVSNTTLYINGVQSSTDIDYPINISSGSIRIGRNRTSFFQGYIDEVMIFNRSLTSTEVKDLYIKGRALWTYSNEQNLTARNTNDNWSLNSFNISKLTTNIQPRFRLVSDSNKFYTPILQATESNPANATTHPDVIAPVVTINFPANTTYGNIHLPLMFNVSLNENGSVKYTLDNGVNNYTMLNTSGGVIGTLFNYSNGTIASGSYTFKVYANDTSGNNNNTANITFAVDVTAPIVTIVSPTATTYSTSSLVFNITLNENGTARYSLNAGLFNYTMTSNATGTGFNATNTSIADGTYTFYAYTNDTSGNNNNTANVTFNVSTSSNSAPIITSVNIASTFSITENSFTQAKLNFTVYDADGFTNINGSDSKASFNRTLETTRLSTTCDNTVNYSTNYANFSCTINIWYFDASGDWTVNASISDTSNSRAVNQTGIFTLGQTSAFVTSPGNLTFASLSPGTSNQTSSNDPLLLNNTGNKNITAGNVQINATHLKGETTSSLGLWAGNFSVGIFTGSNKECDLSVAANSTGMNRSYFQPINQSILMVGNHSANDGITGQEQLYFCIRTIGSELTSQAYSTLTDGPWTVKILALAFTLAPLSRKKKKIKEDKLVKAVLIIEEIKEKHSASNSEVMQVLIEEIQKKYNITKEELLDLIDENKLESIPAGIFAKNLGGLEAICKYLKENRGMSYVEIARLLNRDQRTIWTAYKKASKKVSERIEINENDTLLPLSYLGNREYTIIESSIIYLKEKGFRYVEIARLLNRDQRNIWSTYQKATKYKEKRELK